MRLLILVYYSVFLVTAKLTQNEDEFRLRLIQLTKRQGGLYVKFMQVLAMQTTVFSEAHSNQLLALFDKVGYENMDIKQRLRKELKSSYTQIAAIDEIPFSSGTFAQVYKACLQDGTPVIVKIKKSKLKRKLLVDFLMLSILVKVIDSLYEIPMLDPHKILGKFRKNTYKELDYKNELKNALYVYECYKNTSKVKIPYTYPNLCTKNLIVQEYVDGLPMTELLRARSEDTQLYEEYLTKFNLNIHQLLRNIGYQLSIQGPKFAKFYGDPHPGNLILLGEDRFAFIDFGILDDVEVDRKNFYKIMETVVMLSSDTDLSVLSKELLKFGAKDLYHALETLDSSLPSLSSRDVNLLGLVAANYSNIIKTKSNYFIGIKDEIGGFTEIFYEVIKMGNKFNLKVPDTLFNMMRSSAMFASYARYLLPDTDVMPGVYIQMLKEFKDEVSNGRPLVNNYATEDAVTFLIDWIAGIAEKDALLYSRIRGVIDANINV